MTAIAVCFDPLAGIVFGSDGSSQDTEGRYMGPVGKTILMPEFGAMLMWRGMGLFGHMLRLKMAIEPGQVASFDDLRRELPALSRQMFDEAAPAVAEPQSVAVVLGGWSAERQRFEVVRFGSHERQIGGEGALTVKPWEVIDLPRGWVAPGPTSEGRARIGVDLDAALPGAAWCAAAICAARQSIDPNGPPEDECVVGAYIQITTLTPGRVASEIVHTWPDVVGERIDRDRGEMAPSFLKESAP